TWSEWLHQKQRHLSTGKYYKPLVKCLLGMYAATHGLSWLLFFLLLFFPAAPVFFLFLLRCLLYWTLWTITAAKMKEPKLLKWMPVCDVCWALYNFALSPFIFLKNKQQWK